MPAALIEYVPSGGEILSTGPDCTPIASGLRGWQASILNRKLDSCAINQGLYPVSSPQSKLPPAWNMCLAETSYSHMLLFMKKNDLETACPAAENSSGMELCLVLRHWQAVLCQCPQKIDSWVQASACQVLTAFGGDNHLCATNHTHTLCIAKARCSRSSGSHWLPTS